MSTAIWSVDDHLEDILAAIRPLDPIEVPLLDAQGCVLTEDITVPVALPPFDNSSMDGYAVRVADVQGATEEYPAVLTVIGDVAAGPGGPLTVGPGEAARIMTGAPVPPGAETVVPVEWTDGGAGGGPALSMRPAGQAPAAAGGEVRVHRPAPAGAHIRARGSDARAGELALARDTVLGPPQIALLAAIGRGGVRVRPRPRVVVISTGSELVQPGEPLTEGEIYDSNSFALTAAARDAGALVYRVGAVTDDPELLRSAIEDQLVRADLLVTTGGVSVGAYDVVKEALSAAPGDESALAGSVDFRSLAMQPGKPQGFGTVGPDHTPLLALPGNPVSSYVSFELFVRPAVRRLRGLAELHRPRVRATLAADKALTSPAGRRQFLRGVYEAAEGTVTPVGGSGSHLVAALARANCLFVVPEQETSVSPGAEVEVVLLG
ncbi:gephyrin-like molybdotransferase Glp [Streptomyces sp. NPDC057638]|uniref:molybdotransferase-like divisome protein Glp n=1 Tax=Streptomyces sp. NPDC057638 TaxID=3346190 RepID=UPI0036C19CF0